MLFFQKYKRIAARKQFDTPDQPSFDIRTQMHVEKFFINRRKEILYTGFSFRKYFQQMCIAVFLNYMYKLFLFREQLPIMPMQIYF